MRALGFKYKVCKKGFYVVCHEKHASEKISKGWMGKAKGMSGDTAALIDSEIKVFIDKNYQRAQQILTDNLDILHAMKDALMKFETIDSLQIDDLMNRREVRQPADWQIDDSSDDKGNGKPQAADKTDDVVSSADDASKKDELNTDESPAK